MVPQTPTHIHINVGHPTSPLHTPNAVQAAKINKWKAALRAFEIALSIGSISTTLCTIL
ncbi:Hypothetical predicted protein [Olea europaea subsp. europaea]|uniref:Uncharacterized protein n=2 Tax=Olea europaea subsp. europaea TaxID=158383 RepID=A0A8S0TW16_OLEEU|nr:Hypothetical predicted protein [Olea europaea subsp. europaea]